MVEITSYEKARAPAAGLPAAGLPAVLWTDGSFCPKDGHMQRGLAENVLWRPGHSLGAEEEESAQRRFNLGRRAGGRRDTGTDHRECPRNGDSRYERQEVGKSRPF